PGGSFTINELQYAISPSNTNLSNFVEIKGSAGTSLTCFYLVKLDTNCLVSGAYDLSGNSIPSAVGAGSDPGYFVMAQDATIYATLYGRNPELMDQFADLSDGPAALMLVYSDSAPPKNTSCSSLGALAIYDSVGYADANG